MAMFARPAVLNSLYGLGYFRPDVFNVVYGLQVQQPVLTPIRVVKGTDVRGTWWLEDGFTVEGTLALDSVTRVEGLFENGHPIYEFTFRAVPVVRPRVDALVSAQERAKPN